MYGSRADDTDGLAVWWLGNAGWLIRSGDVLIATDPDLEVDGKVREPPVDAVGLAGDSILTEEHLELEGIDVLFVSPTVHNMYIDRSLILINRLEPAYIFPQHYGTYREQPDNIFWTRGYPDELEERLSSSLRKRFH